MAIKVADAFIAVSGDLSQYRKDLAVGAKDAQSLGQQIKAALTNPAGFGGSSKLAGFIADLRLGRSLTSSLRDAAQGLGGSLKGLSVKALQTGLNGIKNTLGGLASAGKSVLQGIFQGIGIGIFQSATRAISDLINFIPNLIQRGREYGIVVDQISDATGATAEASSRLAGTLQYLGAPIGSIVSLLGQMSRNLEENEPKLNALGVATKDANGGLLNQVQILENARQAFSRYGDGTAKANLIAREFGRGGLTILVDYLKLTDEQAQKVTEDLQAQGLIISESQRQMAETAQREGNRFQNALTGLGTTLFSVVGPQITAFFSNLSDTITAHATEISNAIAEVVSFILGMVSSLTGAGASLQSFSGSIASGSRVVSPYSSQLLQLNLELADLDDKQKAATGSADGQREAIQRQIAVVQREIEVLRRQEAAQESVFKRAISGLARVYQLRLDALDLAQREREELERQRDLNERLNEAQLALAEAQRPALGGTVDAQKVADAMARVAEIQRDQSDLARQTQEDDQRRSLESTRDYIESIGKLVEDADNKKAALNTLRRREDVLEARRQAQLAAGDTGGAAETTARIEAIKTAEVRVQEQIRNEARESALERQKSLLEREKAAVKNAVVDQTAIRRAEIEKQIADLKTYQAKWDSLTVKQKADLLGITGQISGEGGLTSALQEARDKGVEFGDSVKEAFDKAAVALGFVLDGLKWIVDNLDKIGLAFRYITDTEFRNYINEAAKEQGNPLGVIGDILGGIGDILGSGGHKGLPADLLDSFASGGRVSGPTGTPRIIRAHGGEEVLSASLSARLDRFFSMPRVPAMAAASFGTVTVPVYLDGREIANVVSRIQADERRY